MKELLIFMISSLVDNKNAVKIDQINGENCIVFKISVADSDKGKIIGKGGKTAQTIRSIIKSIALKEKKKIILEIN